MNKRHERIVIGVGVFILIVAIVGLAKLFDVCMARWDDVFWCLMVIR